MVPQAAQRVSPYRRSISLRYIWIVEFIFTQTLYYETNSYSQITANNNNKVGEGLYTLVERSVQHAAVSQQSWLGKRVQNNRWDKFKECFEFSVVDHGQPRPQGPPREKLPIRRITELLWNKQNCCR